MLAKANIRFRISGGRTLNNGLPRWPSILPFFAIWDESGISDSGVFLFCVSSDFEGSKSTMASTGTTRNEAMNRWRVFELIDLSIDGMTSWWAGPDPLTHQGSGRWNTWSTLAATLPGFCQSFTKIHPRSTEARLLFCHAMPSLPRPKPIYAPRPGERFPSSAFSLCML